MAFYFGHFRTLHGFAWDSLLEIFSISNTPDYLTVNIPLWFLVGLFVMQIIFWCLNRVIPRNKYRSCWFLVILAARFLVDQQDKSFQAGKDSCVAVQATAQVAHDKEVRNTYDQIDRDTPSGLVDDRATIDFLLGHTRNTGK